MLAFFWDAGRRSGRRDNDLVKRVEDFDNEHNMVVYNVKKTHKSISDRDFLSRILWQKASDGDGYDLVMNPEDRTDSNSFGGSVTRGTLHGARRIRRKNDKETSVEYAVKINFGGSLPAWLTNKYLKDNLLRLSEVQECFQEYRGLDVWDADDGRVVGEMMCTKTEAEEQHGEKESNVGARMRELFLKHRGLREIGEKHRFFFPMIVRVVENKLRKASDVNTKLCDVSKKEGRAIGATLALAIATNLTPEAGVDEWILKQPALRQFDKEEIWFRRMMNVVAKMLLGEVSWGLKMRVCSGAGLSILDMATDLFVIVTYMRAEETRGYGYSLMGMLALSMLLQLALVFAQNKEKPLLTVKEMLIVISGMKPGVDSYRVCSGQVMEVHHSVDAKTELVITKCIEMVCESIPGCVLQMFVLMKAGTVSKAAVGSVVISALTTGFSSASISFE